MEEKELKVVVYLKGDRALVSVQEQGADPVMEMVAGTLEEALGAVPGILGRARERWAQSPRNPKYTGPPVVPPAPAPAPQPGRATPAPARSRERAPRPETPSEGQINSLF